MIIRCCDFIELFFKIFRINNVLTERLFSGLKTGVESTPHPHTPVKSIRHFQTRANPFQPKISHFHTIPLLRQKSVTYTQIGQFQANQSVPHKSVNYTQVMSLRQVTSTKKALYKRTLQFLDLCGNDGFLSD